jgi:hypothetical protein
VIRGYLERKSYKRLLLFRESLNAAFAGKKGYIIVVGLKGFKILWKKKTKLIFKDGRREEY